MKNFFDVTTEANIEIMKLISISSHSYLCEKVSLGAGGDVSRKIDILAEDIFIKHLKSFGDIYSEECGYIQGDGEFEIIIDPLDGSDNFVSNLPYFGTSVALKYKNRCVEAMIVNLANGDIFYKNQDLFQKANIKTLNFEDVKKNSLSTIGIFERSYSSKNLLDKFRTQKVKFRSPGAFALSLAYAHEVSFVAFEGEMRMYDIEAGLFMCEDLSNFISKGIVFISKDKEFFDKMSQLLREGEKI